jgi:hypothetical protein
VAAEAALLREARLEMLTTDAPSIAMLDGTRPEVFPDGSELLSIEMPSPAKARAAKAAPRLCAGDSGTVGPELVDGCSEAIASSSYLT